MEKINQTFAKHIYRSFAYRYAVKHRACDAYIVGQAADRLALLICNIQLAGRVERHLGPIVNTAYRRKPGVAHQAVYACIILYLLHLLCRPAMIAHDLGPHGGNAAARIIEIVKICIVVVAWHIFTIVIVRILLAPLRFHERIDARIVYRRQAVAGTSRGTLGNLACGHAFRPAGGILFQQYIQRVFVCRLEFGRLRECDHLGISATAGNGCKTAAIQRNDMELAFVGLAFEGFHFAGPRAEPAFELRAPLVPAAQPAFDRAGRLLRRDRQPLVRPASLSARANREHGSDRGRDDKP